jgi:hypothetical protein
LSTVFTPGPSCVQRGHQRRALTHILKPSIPVLVMPVPEIDLLTSEHLVSPPSRGPATCLVTHFFHIPKFLLDFNRKAPGPSPHLQNHKASR